MPFDNLPYADLMAKHGFVPANHQAPVFFPVAARRLFDEAGHELPGYKRIVREDTGETLHVATDAYKIVTNEEAFGGFEEALRKSSLDLTDMQVATDYASHGCRVFRQYLLPAHTVEVKPGDAVALRLLMMNSYDGSLAFTGRCGAYSFVCANTSIWGKDISSFRMRHAGGVDPTKAIEGLTKAAEQHIEAAERLKVLPGVSVSDQMAREVFQAMPSATKSLVDHLVHAWIVARDGDDTRAGANAWCLWNVLTAWASHGEVKTRKATGEVMGGGAIRFDRETRVHAVTTGEVWRDMVERAVGKQPALIEG